MRVAFPGNESRHTWQVLLQLFVVFPVTLLLKWLELVGVNEIYEPWSFNC
jgi:hypothetical protein